MLQNAGKTFVEEFEKNESGKRVDEIVGYVKDFAGRIFTEQTLTVFGEDFKFHYGFWELFLYAAASFVIGYYFVYLVLVEYVLWEFGLKFLVFRVGFQFLLRTVILGGVLRLSWTLLSCAFSLAIFFVKLAFCCGCCGACFRRKAAAAKGKVSVVPKAPVQGAAAAGKPLLRPSALPTKAAGGSKKKK